MANENSQKRMVSGDFEGCAEISAVVPAESRKWQQKKDLLVKTGAETPQKQENATL